MKKLTLLFSLLALVAAVVVANRPVASDVTNGDDATTVAPQKVVAAEVPPPTTIPNSLIDTKEKTSQIEVKSLHEFKMFYRQWTRAELARELQSAADQLDQSGLIDKAQRENLAPDEAAFVRNEIRRQGVLSQLLTAEDLKKMKRKYL